MDLSECNILAAMSLMSFTDFLFGLEVQQDSLACTQTKYLICMFGFDITCIYVYLPCMFRASSWLQSRTDVFQSYL